MGSTALEELQAGGDGDGPGPTGLAQHHPDLQRKPGYPALIGCMSSGRRAAVVWEGPNAVCSSRAMTGHTDSAEAGPSTVGAHQNPRRQEHRPRLRLHGGGSGEIQLRFQNSELVHWADETHQGSIHPAWALRLPLAPAATQDQLPLSTRT